MRAEFYDLDPFAVAKAQNIYVELPPVENDLTVEDIAQRIADNRASFESKFKTRKAKQDDYYLKYKKSSSIGENPETPKSSTGTPTTPSQATENGAT